MSRNDPVTIDAVIVHETKNAVLLDHGGKSDAWVAKQHVKDNGDGTFTLPEWVAEEKGMI